MKQELVPCMIICKNGAPAAPASALAQQFHDRSQGELAPDQTSFMTNSENLHALDNAVMGLNQNPLMKESYQLILGTL